MNLEIHGQKVNLLPQHALYLEDLDILAIADVHICNSQQQLSSLPYELNRCDLDRIMNLVKELQPESLYIIGDFIHDIRGLTPELVQKVTEWRKELNCAVVLLDSHHDRKIHPLLHEWNIVLAQSMTVGNFVFSHEPSKPDKPGQVVVSGHVHPTIVLESDQNRRRLPCFVWEEPQFILPAFGTVIGNAEIRRRSEGRYFSVTSGQVIEV